MEVKIRVYDDPDGLVLPSLHRWLAQDTDVTRGTIVHLDVAARTTGDMGGVLDAITAMVNDGIALGSLIGGIPGLARLPIAAAQSNH